MLGRAIIRARGVQIKPLVSLARKTTPLTPAYVTRALTTQIFIDPIKTQLENTVEKTIETAAVPTEKEFLATMDQCKATGDIVEAIKAVQKAEEFGLASPELYRHLLEIVNSAPFDIEYASIVAYWFYAKNPTLSDKVLKDVTIWKDILKMAFHFGETYRSEDLRALLEKFSQTFDLKELKDQEAWELLIKGWGILGKDEKIIKHFDTLEKSIEDKISFRKNALIAFAMIDCEDKVQEIFSALDKENALSRDTLDRLARIYAFKGSVELTARYNAVSKELYPDNQDNTMLLMAHKVALGKIANVLVNRRGSRGLSLKPNDTSKIDSLHNSWKNLTKGMLSGEHPVDITDCNIILEYLTIANRIDPVEYPMEKVEMLFENFMPEHGIKPNETTYHIIMQGYATTQQYNDSKHNIRLDKTLQVVPKMQENGIKINDTTTFHTLFRACLPHQNGQYYFDNFKSASLLPLHGHLNVNVDKRLFSVEKIMLDAHLPHDRVTFSTILTCLAAGNRFDAFNARWNTFRIHGLSPDAALYQKVFELSSLNAEQSKKAIRQIRQDMLKDISDKRKINFDIHCAMLNCCITAQLPQDAKAIMDTMRQRMAFREKNKNLQKDEHWPAYNSPKVYSTFLRAYTLIRGLNANPIIREINEKGIEYDQDIWELMLTKYAIENDYKNVRRLFNKYTMSRFEQKGYIPIPVRDTSPMIPFPSAPYNRLDVEFVNVYISTLVDTQNISLVFDVLRTWSEQSSKLSINRSTLVSAIKLAKKEKDIQSLEWLATEIMPKCIDQSKRFRRLEQHVNHYIQKK